MTTELQATDLMPGCYVEGSHGQYAERRFIELFSEYVPDKFGAYDWLEAFPLHENGKFTDEESERFTDGGIDICDNILDALNERLPDDLYGAWIDGEFFIVSMSASEDAI